MGHSVEMDAGRCERKAGHPGTCMTRCRKQEGCTEPVGHRRHCTLGTFNSIGWASDDTARCSFPSGTVERVTPAEVGREVQS